MLRFAVPVEINRSLDRESTGSTAADGGDLLVQSIRDCRPEDCCTCLQGRIRRFPVRWLHSQWCDVFSRPGSLIRFIGRSCCRMAWNYRAPSLHA